MRTAAILLTAVIWPFATARAAELNLYVTSNGEATVVVEPGATVDFEVTGVLTDTDNEGLSFFLFDLTFDGGPLIPVDTPAGMPLANFTPPEGFTNPEGYEGAVIDGVLHQVGGSQNTLKSPLMTGSVITGLGHTPIVLATGSLTAPMADGAYTLTAAEVLGRVIEDGDDGSGEIWATEWAFEGEVTGLQVFVGPECTTVADCADLNGDLVRDDGCMWWACVDGLCEGTEIVFADMGGSFNDYPICAPTGDADGNDRFHALLCFQNRAFTGPCEYECEDNTPNALNVDAGGRLGNCEPDGVCDANDAFHALRAFNGVSTCTCPLDEASPDPIGRRTPSGTGGSRVFMAPIGLQNSAAEIGNTTMTIAPGASARIGVWIDATGHPGDVLSAYQLMIEDSATPQPGATGFVHYTNNPNDPCQGHADSVALDRDRTDWVFADSVVANTVYLNETPASGCFGGVYLALIDQDYVDPASLGIRYLMEFDLHASADAQGEFELEFILDQSETPRPLTDLFSPEPLGSPYPVGQYQPLTVSVSRPCLEASDCADVDRDGIRDNSCIWWECDAGQCSGTDIVFADMGGQFGACPPDGAADGNDRFLALTCFAGQGWQNGECEPDPPNATNLDAGGPFGSCDPDGVCDGNDAFAALNAFSGESSCACPLDGAPMPEVAQPVVTGTATIELRPTRKQLRPGETIAIEAYLTTPLDDLRGYQLHLGTAGGTHGHLDLVDISIDRRRDAALAEHSPWTAFNVHTGQMVAGLDTPGIRTVSRAYLATFTWRASRDAAGPFRIELLADGTDSSHRTFLFRTDPRAVTEIGVEPVTVEVVAGEKRGEVR